MLKSDFFCGIIFIVLLVISIIRWICYKNGKYQFIISLLLNVYICMLVKITLFNIPIQHTLLLHLRELGQGESYNFIPFHTILEIVKYDSIDYLLRQIGGNIILLMPLGIYLFLLCDKFRKFKVYIMIILGASLLIECMQGMIGYVLRYHYRSVDIDDIILNIFGGIIGYLLSLLILPLFRKVQTQI